MLRWPWLLVAAGALVACQRRSEPSESLGTIRLGTRSDPKFDEAWRTLVARRGEKDTFFIQATPRAQAGPPHQPSGDEVSAAIRANLAGIEACYLRLTGEGRFTSGRAILSFVVEQDGSAKNVKVEAPAFADSGLPGCVSQQVERWTFPRSKKGGQAVSYPFVFVGG
jgi:hypothetical protein